MEASTTPCFIDDESVLELISAFEKDIDAEKKFAVEVIDVPIEEKKYTCGTCSASYKTTAGLNRHTSMKYQTVTLTETNIKLILYRSCEEISNDECYGKEINAKFKYYYEENCFDSSQFITHDFFKIVDKLCLKLSKSKKKEIFFSEFYGKIAVNSGHFFPEMESTEASLLAINICQKLINEIELQSRPQMPTNSSVAILTERDLSAIEYLAGYVIRKLYYQQKKHSNKLNEIICAVMEAFRNEHIEDLELVSCLSRGGLWGITDMARSLFIAAEKKFRAETCNEGNLKTIKIDLMVAALMQSFDLNTLFLSILNDCSLFKEEYEEVSKNILEKIFTLYLRVRAFSMVKDLTVKLKHTYKEKQKKKGDKEKNAAGKKALRKELKRAENLTV